MKIWRERPRSGSGIMSPPSPPVTANHGHTFSKKTFHKPTYCHHCTDMLWGLIQQGYICEGELWCLFEPSHQILTTHHWITKSSSSHTIRTHLRLFPSSKHLNHRVLNVKTKTRQKKHLIFVPRSHVSNPIQSIKACSMSFSYKENSIFHSMFFYS